MCCVNLLFVILAYRALVSSTRIVMASQSLDEELGMWQWLEAIEINGHKVSLQQGQKALRSQAGPL